MNVLTLASSSAEKSEECTTILTPFILTFMLIRPCWSVTSWNGGMVTGQTVWDICKAWSWGQLSFSNVDISFLSFKQKFDIFREMFIQLIWLILLWGPKGFPCNMWHINTNVRSWKQSVHLKLFASTENEAVQLSSLRRLFLEQQATVTQSLHFSKVHFDFWFI